MQKLLLRVLLQMSLMAIMLLVCIQLAIWCYRMPQPLAVIATFLSWVGAGILWQEVARRLPARLGLERGTPPGDS